MLDDEAVLRIPIEAFFFSQKIEAVAKAESRGATDQELRIHHVKSAVAKTTIIVFHIVETLLGISIHW